MKLANIELSSPVSGKSKQVGLDCMTLAKNIIKKIDSADDHLTMIQSSFEKFPTSDSDLIWKERKFLRGYRDEVVKNYIGNPYSKNKEDSVKSLSFKFLKSVEYFNSDMELSKIVESFISGVSELQDLIDIFVDGFSDLQDKDFITNITKVCGNILKQTSKIRDIIEDRFNSYINKNVLNSNWFNDLKNEG